MATVSPPDMVLRRSGEPDVFPIINTSSAGTGFSPELIGVGPKKIQKH